VTELTGDDLNEVTGQIDLLDALPMFTRVHIAPLEEISVVGTVLFITEKFVDRVITAFFDRIQWPLEVDLLSDKVMNQLVDGFVFLGLDELAKLDFDRLFNV
jgi:hypothetical protein